MSEETELELSIYEYCAEDDSYTVRGDLGYAPDLSELKKQAELNFQRVVDMEQLEALVIIKEDVTIHLHADGEAVINGVQSEAEAEELMKKIV